MGFRAADTACSRGEPGDGNGRPNPRAEVFAKARGADSGWSRALPPRNLDFGYPLLKNKLIHLGGRL